MDGVRDGADEAGLPDAGIEIPLGPNGQCLMQTSTGFVFDQDLGCFDDEAASRDFFVCARTRTHAEAECQLNAAHTPFLSPDGDCWATDTRCQPLGWSEPDDRACANAPTCTELLAPDAQSDCEFGESWFKLFPYVDYDESLGCYHQLEVVTIRMFGCLDELTAFGCDDATAIAVSPTGKCFETSQYCLPEGWHRPSESECVRCDDFAVTTAGP